MGKINGYDKIMTETKKDKIWKSKKFLHKSPPKRWFRNGIHSLLRQAIMPGEALTYRYLVGHA